MSALTTALRDTGVRPVSVVIAVGAGTMALGSAVGLAATAAWLIARAAQMPSPADIALAAVIVRFFGISRGLFRYLERIASHRTALSGVVTLRERTYRRLASHDPHRVLSLSRGDIVARLGGDLDAVGDAVVRAMIPLAVALTVSVGAVAVVGSQLPVAGVALALCLALAAGVPAVLTWRSARIAATLGTRAHARVSVAALSAIESATEHHVWGTTEETFNELESANHDVAGAHEAAAKPAAWSAATQAAWSGLALVAALLLGIAAIRAGDISGPAGAIVALTPLAAFEAVGAVPAAVQQYFRSSMSAVRLHEITAEHSATYREQTSSEKSPVTGIIPPQSATLELDHVSAAWPHMTPTRPVTASVPPGGCLGITGSSGAGKTTLLMTLAGALAPAAGGVRFGGCEVTEAHTGTSIAMTAEDAHIFGTSVLENLRVARGDVTEAAARDALTTVGLGDWIEGLSHGIDTELGSGGHTVSGGERRRLLLARVLLTPAPVHLIDEPSEHLDEDGVAAFRALISAMRAQGRTVVIVTHDHALLDLADQVVSLDG